ncbi:TorF family putative porin [Alteromonas sp. ASW11-19]|uniref:TorF family putative porin n=1 Tax=Alteromonas salexigens TaxID=2982530 RepID=A0ABT2VKL4_9ALTE|nr:TorF family putative porin [Alteromonas salexigens]MCU7553322.1 TorF family putative porin [Alteromonas salexigens]
MKTVRLSALALVIASTAGLGQAQAAVEANIGVTSNYLWRGVTQSMNDPSVSGGLDYSHESGFYAGTWIGTIDWGNGSGTENDYYLGYSGMSGDFGYDVGYIHYVYPATGYENSDFGEVYFNGSYMGLGFGVAYTVASDVADGSLYDSGDIYYNVSYGWDLPEEFGLSMTYGYYDFDAGDDSDYGHFQADLSKGDFTLTVSKAQQESGDDDTKFVVSWGTTF